MKLKEIKNLERNQRGEKNFTYKEIKIWVILDFLSKVCRQDERGVKYLKCWKRENKPTYNSLLNKAFLWKWTWNTFSKTNKQTKKLREFVTSRPALEEMLKEVLQREEKPYRKKPWIYIKEEYLDKELMKVK